MQSLCRHTLTSIAAIVAIIGLMFGCATKPGIEEVVEGPDPTNLTVDPRSEALDLRWDTNRREGDMISGYMVYFAESGGEFERHNEQSYPGDNNAETEFETYPLEGLVNGTRYRVYVTTLLLGNVESLPTNTVESIPRPEGRVLLAESFSGANEGFSFARGEHVATDDLDNDIYLATINGSPHLASPNRIDYILRATGFFDLGAAKSIDEVEVTDQHSGDPLQLLEVREGNAVLFKDADNSYGLIYIRSVRGGEKRIIEFDYIYQTKPETLLFH